MKITGQIRYRYIQNKYEKDGDTSKPSQSDLRTRLIFTGKVNDNWDYVTRLQNIQSFHKDSDTTTIGHDAQGNAVTKVNTYDYTGEDSDVKINRAFLTGHLGEVNVKAGRADLWLADGQVYDDTFDGISMDVGDKYKFGAFWGKMTEAAANTEWDDTSDEAWGVNVDFALGHSTNLFGGYTDISLKEDEDYGKIFNDDNVKITNAGLKFGITDDVALTGGYLHTNADDNENGWYAILGLWGADYKKPGSFGFQANYYYQPAASAQSHTMNGDVISQDLWADGFKGYSVSASYTVAKNMMATVEYYDLKSREDSGTKNKMVYSEFQLRF